MLGGSGALNGAGPSQFKTGRPTLGGGGFLGGGIGKKKSTGLLERRMQGINVKKVDEREGVPEANAD